jgi:succinate dehydrogenase / fumarate reductase, cytochrome b subunit
VPKIVAQVLGDRGAASAQKLHSLTGVVPLGVFLALHLVINARALQGRDALDRTVRGILSIPLLSVIELFGVLLPLLFHAAYGIKLSLSRRTEPAAYPANWVLLQRATGFSALLFIAFHLYDLRWPVLAGYMTEADLFPVLAAKLSSTNSWGIPLFAVAYLVGVAATVFHFATGLFAFCVSWGYAGTERAIRIARIACGSLGIVLFLIGASTVVYYATGSRFFFTELGLCSRTPTG